MIQTIEILQDKAKYKTFYTTRLNLKSIFKNVVIRFMIDISYLKPCFIAE